MEWVRILAYITGSVDEELLLRNEHLATENQILRAQVKGRLLLSDAEKKTLAEMGSSARSQGTRGRRERREAGDDSRLVVIGPWIDKMRWACRIDLKLRICRSRCRVSW